MPGLKPDRYMALPFTDGELLPPMPTYARTVPAVEPGDETGASLWLRVMSFPLVKAPLALSYDLFDGVPSAAAVQRFVTVNAVALGYDGAEVTSIDTGIRFSDRAAGIDWIGRNTLEPETPYAPRRDYLNVLCGFALEEPK